MKFISAALIVSFFLIPLHAEEPRWSLFPKGAFKASGTSGKQSPPKDLELCFDGRQNTFGMFDQLKSSEITLEFDKPLVMENLVVIQAGWGNWAHPASLEVTVNGAGVKVSGLENLPANGNRGTTGKVQLIPVNEAVRSLKLKVTDVYMQNGIPWGSIGELGYTVKQEQTLVATPQRQLKMTPWKNTEFTSSATGGKGEAPENLSAAFANKGGDALFTPLKGSRIEIEFKESRPIGFIAFKQGNWGNWSKVREMGVSLDGGPKRNVLFADSRDTQAVAINAAVRKIVFTILDVYSGPGIAPWGGFSAIGEAEFEPVAFSPAAKPFPMTAEALEFEVEASRAMRIPVSAQIIAPKLIYRAPDLQVRPGRNKYRILLKEFRETGAFGMDWKACHILNLRLGVDPKAADPGFRLIGVEPVNPAGAPENPWYDLGSFQPPTRTIDGKVWTEGMSYSSSGRFGNSTYNGLLSEVVGDLWFHTYTAGARDQLRRQKFDFYIDGSNSGQNNLDSAQPWIINGLDIGKDEEIVNSWTHMSRKLKLAEGTELSYLLSSLAPGFLMESSRPFTVSSRGGGDIPKRSGAPDEDENRFFRDADRDGKTPKNGPTLVITPDRIISGPGEVQMEKLSAPWIVAVWGGIKRPAFWGDQAAAVLFTLDQGKVRWDRGGVSLPGGQRVGVSSSFHGLFGTNWQASAVRERALLLCEMLRNYPYQCREFYRVEGDEVQIRNEFQYAAWGNSKFRAPDYAPLPPMFTWGVLSCGWGKLPLDRKCMINTPTGPYSWNPGKEVSYTLPIPVNRHAAFPANADFQELNNELAANYLALPEPGPEEFHRIANAWTSAYRPLRVGGSVLGSSYLGDAYRKRLLDTLKVTSANAFRDFAWIPRKEQFSERRYLASLWVDNKVSPAMFGDINSGIGAANYALYTYAKYSGDWEHARKLWPRVLDSIRFCEVVNDWAVPMTSAREGILFGGIDMDTIGFLGVTAAEQLARQVGGKEDLERLTYLRAKIAPATALRLNFQNYLDPKGEFPRLWVNGFSESGANLEWADSKSGVGLDHIAMSFCWQGQQPEMYQFLMQLPGEKTMTAIQKVLMDQYFTGEDFSGWRKMPFNPTRTAAHLAMRSCLPGWNRTELERDYRIWIERSKGEKNSFNSGFFGVYQGSVDRIYLINWEPAALGNLTFDRSAGALTAALASGKPFVLEGSSPGKITRIEVDGNEIPLPQIRYEGEIFFLTLPAVKEEVKLHF